MFNTDKKEPPKKHLNLRNNKPLKVSSLPEIQLDKLLAENSKKDMNDKELKLALSNTSESSRHKGDELEFNSPILNQSGTFSSKKSTPLTQNKNTVSRFDLLSRNEVNEKPHLLKVLEDLAESKHQNTKLQNEINVLNQKINGLKNLVSMKNKEIDMINKKHKEIIDKFNLDNQNCQRVNAEYFMIQEAFKKQHVTFKSTINTLIDVLDIFLVAPTNASHHLTLSKNNSGFDNAIEAASILGNEEKKVKATNDIKNLLLNNLTYIHNNLNLDLEEEIQKIKGWCILPPLKPIINEDFEEMNKNLSCGEDDIKTNFESVFSSIMNLSPKFHNNLDSVFKDNTELKTTQDNSPQVFMSNFNGSLRDLQTNESSNREEKPPSKGEINLNFNFNNNPTEFNIDILNDLQNNETITHEDVNKNK